VNYLLHPNLKPSPALRLTGWYLAFVMLLSLGFSSFVYNVSLSGLQRGLRQPAQNQPAFFQDQHMFNDFRIQRIQEEESNLKANILVFNLLVFVVGGGVSYFFARRTIRPIEEALESQTRFTADASHELRTPLTIMQTEIEVAIRDKKMTIGGAREQLDSNLDEVIKLKNLVDGLLRLARSNTSVESLKTVDLKKIIGDAVKVSAKLAKSKKIKIITSGNTVKATGDSAQLKELVGILLDNAIKYSEDKSNIQVVLESSVLHAIIKVTDQGVGIKPGQLPFIFDRFYRGDASRSRQNVEGFGIGLSIAKKIVTAHDGSIGVKSSNGNGTTFTIKLPKK